MRKMGTLFYQGVTASESRSGCRLGPLRLSSATHAGQTLYHGKALRPLRVHTEYVVGI